MVFEPEAPAIKVELSAITGRPGGLLRRFVGIGYCVYQTTLRCDDVMMMGRRVVGHGEESGCLSLSTDIDKKVGLYS
jgi:hypothetical protein